MWLPNVKTDSVMTLLVTYFPFEFKAFRASEYKAISMPLLTANNSVAVAESVKLRISSTVEMPLSPKSTSGVELSSVIEDMKIDLALDTVPSK
mmetsp:Transcript_42173/g.48964  ORF Transcript_42173/g.48964 Transcript_42173/m.48964 type:complete len:93 (+) Transcript_42173:2800-3078(+)